MIGAGRKIAGRLSRSRLLPRPVQEPIERWCWSRAARRALDVPRRPVGFNEKTRYKMARDLRPALTTLSDKVAVRGYIERVVGPEVLPELYLATYSPDDVRHETLPREVAVKVSHASGGVVLVSESAPRESLLREPHAGWARFLVHPDSVDWDVLRALCGDWLSLRFRPDTQWATRQITPRILAEELVHESGTTARDFKLFTFHGRVRLVSVDVNRFADHVRTLYAPDWERLPFELNFPAGLEVERPPQLEDMIEIAERLAGGTDFLRVDLYAPGGRIVVGELTSFHGAGEEEFRPASYDRWLGSYWSPPRRYRAEPFGLFASRSARYKRSMSSTRRSTE
ncbi:MAG: ATP-grasp fold amidoligase family protein [Gaiellaceae bacterium]